MDWSGIYIGVETYEDTTHNPNILYKAPAKTD